jgi:hypothetical protein
MPCFPRLINMFMTQTFIVGFEVCNGREGKIVLPCVDAIASDWSRNEREMPNTHRRTPAFRQIISTMPQARHAGNGTRAVCNKSRL